MLALLAMGAVLPAVFSLPRMAIGVLAIATAVAATAGDLLGSVPKRRAGIKDYPVILRGQGGLLDILDAWLVTGPLVAALWLMLGRG
jgi:phosphatidate cytidylyltransferase